MACASWVCTANEGMHPRRGGPEKTEGRNFPWPLTRSGPLVTHSPFQSELSLSGRGRLWQDRTLTPFPGKDATLRG